MGATVIDDNGPSLLQTMSAAIDLHKQYTRAKHSPVHKADYSDLIAAERRQAAQVGKTTGLTTTDHLRKIAATPPPSDGNPLLRLASASLRLGAAHMAKGASPSAAFATAARATRILKDIKVSKISAVDRPANPHCLAHLIKSNPTPEATMDYFEALEAQCDEMIAKIDSVLGKRKTKTTLTHDDGRDDHSSVDSTGSETSMDSDDPDDYSSEADQEDDDEDDDDVSKASHDTFLATGEESADHRPGSLTTSKHPTNRHRFEALTYKLSQDHGIPKTAAAAMARSQFPDVFASYQDHTKQVNKSVSYESLVATEMRKGCNSEVAAQRVSQMWGNAAPVSAIAKHASNITETFQSVASDIALRDGIPMTEALQKCRRERPNVFRKMQAA